jgi:putative heme transporter
VPLLAVANTAVRYLAAHLAGEPTADCTPPGTDPTDEDQADAEHAVEEAAERSDPDNPPDEDTSFSPDRAPVAAVAGHTA